MQKRWPAEWEVQDGVLLAWPHEHTDWASDLDAAMETFEAIVHAISRFERVVLVHPEHYDIPCNDTWARDFGPITIEEEGRPVLLDFTFNGWGGKFEAGLDNHITRGLHEQGAFGATPRRTVDFILEGGSIESDGEGGLLTTTACLLNPNRNPSLSRQQIEDRLRDELGVRRFYWLEHGALEGDDTDAHIDTLARFAPQNTIVYVACDDPTDPHFPSLMRMQDELRAFKDIRLLPLPWPRAHYDEQGARLPATYANYLVINGAVLVPTYNDPADDRALGVLAQAYPGREILGIDCCPLIRQHGSLHCVTMQLPRGVLPAQSARLADL